nr:10971_t:CDS:2 [Entrophospora candida]
MIDAKLEANSQHNIYNINRVIMERAIKKTEKLIDTAEDDQEKNELEEN